MKRLVLIVPAALVTIATAVPGLAVERDRVFPNQVTEVVAPPAERAEYLRDPTLSPHAGSAAAGSGAYSISLGSIGQPPPSSAPTAVQTPNLERKDVIRELNETRFRVD